MDGYGDDYRAGVSRAWEASTNEVDSMGVRRVVARLGVVLSRSGGAFPKMSLPFQFFAGGPLGSGNQWISWIHMEDVIRGIQFLIDHDDVKGKVNLTATPVQNREFARILGKAMKRPAFLTTPGFALRALFGEMSIVLLEGQKVSADLLKGYGFTFRYPKLSSAVEELIG
jgi:uncharacterized protein (TIGR01777 family)